MVDKPHRVQLRRAKGWRMPENTVKVDRTTKWGNPFVTGRDGTQEECVRRFRMLMAGYLCISDSKIEPGIQELYRAHLKQNLHRLRGRNLACWCEAGTPCHADVLLEIANAEDVNE